MTKVTFRKFTFLAASMLVGAQMTSTAMAQSIPTLPPPLSSQPQMQVQQMPPGPPVAPMVSQVNSITPQGNAVPQMALSSPTPSGDVVMNNMVYSSPYAAVPVEQAPAPQYITMQRESYWYVNAEALFLHMSKAADQPVAINTNGDTVLSTTSKNPGFTPGMRFALGWVLNDVSTIEASYFGLSQWTSNAGYISGAGDLQLPGDIAGATTDFTSSNAFFTTYKSALYNAELNHLWSTDSPGIQFITGFRYLNLHEFYNINSVVSDTQLSDYRIRTHNDLYGGQIGLKLKKEWGGFGISLTGKSGLYGNSTGQQTFLGDNTNTTVVRDSSTNGTSLAFINELNPNLHARLNDIWCLRAGMDFLWISGVSRAPNQLDFTNNPPDSGTSLSNHSNVFLYGFNVGLSATF